jgi:hypothetical protein
MDRRRARRGARDLADPGLQPPGAAPQRGRLGLLVDRRAAEAARRPDPEPGRVREGLRGARVERVRGGQPGPQRDARRHLAAGHGGGEAYPQLRAVESFKALQDELSDTENKIAAARRYYNTTVRRYNTALQSVPTNVIAGATGFTRREFYRIEDDADREPVAVKLGT